ncbi:hypothetical protein GCM10027275_50280 [Rhabdobacter roseus]|uniref:Uncharacterized protein n=1 Tax=Rhabdobacter roseus TaxID=1655419 RepID=A0A840U4T4_9BACT|nr:hypothetical protein [Rhabdobacter roseus]MBB5287100.1 hypothetical protein [Rhabdobacter roseus]
MSNAYQPSTEADDLNPNLLFSTTWTELLVAIANGQVDAQELARQQLAGRGLDLLGKWVGYKKK